MDGSEIGCADVCGSLEPSLASRLRGMTHDAFTKFHLVLDQCVDLHPLFGISQFLTLSAVLHVFLCTFSLKCTLMSAHLVPFFSVSWLLDFIRESAGSNSKNSSEHRIAASRSACAASLAVFCVCMDAQHFDV